jgi:2-polyprenyl-3-methyl-5-hydroxy-6-metoxy-1,4-benzoquinol methylase
VLAWLGLQEPQSETTAETAMRWHAEAAARWLQTVGKSRVLSLREAQRCHPATAICQAAAERALATRLALPPDVPDTLARLDHLGVSPDFLLNKADPQAVGFMVDILHLLRRLLLPSNSGRHFSVLDIGAKTGAGSHLLAWLTQPASYSKIKLDVSCADIDTTFQTYCRQRYPQVRFLAEDPLQPGRSWDIVIASHVIEHVDDPLAFARRLQASARKAVVLAFPFAENPQDLLAGHLHSLGHDFLRQLAPSHYEIYDGLFFSQSLCCVAVVDAQAGQPENEP